MEWVWICSDNWNVVMSCFCEWNVQSLSWVGSCISWWIFYVEMYANKHSGTHICYWKEYSKCLSWKELFVGHKSRNIRKSMLKLQLDIMVIQIIYSCVWSGSCDYYILSVFCHHLVQKSRNSRIWSAFIVINLALMKFYIR